MNMFTHDFHIDRPVKRSIVSPSPNSKRYPLNGITEKIIRKRSKSKSSRLVNTNNTDKDMVIREIN